ncbi:MAG: hypothetical protein QOJ13_3448 [Gaiellales bacterium]|jgi:hypothetical protein|nr:hypothetical protein [Gaiellales bacterium]
MSEIADVALKRRGIVRFHSSVAGLGELVVFVALGLTIPITELAWET